MISCMTSPVKGIHSPVTAIVFLPHLSSQAKRLLACTKKWDRPWSLRCRDQSRLFQTDMPGYVRRAGQKRYKDLQHALRYVMLWCTFISCQSSGLRRKSFLWECHFQMLVSWITSCFAIIFVNYFWVSVPEEKEKTFIGRHLLKGIVHPKMNIYWQCIQDEGCTRWRGVSFLSKQIWRNVALHYITISSMDLLQWMGAVRMRVQTADKNTTIIHK